MPKVSKSNFFENQEEQSKVKSQIVAHYFTSWARVMCWGQWRTDKRIAYIDLYCGPGIYDDGSKSTPILILESALQDENIRKNLITYFNDENKEAIKRLEAAIQQVDPTESLSHKPKLSSDVVGKKIVEEFKTIQFPPTILFLDPWGYRGLSVDLINAVVKDWGCECVFFFNFKRINAALGTDLFDRHLKKIIREEQITLLKERLKDLAPAQREEEIMETLKNELTSTEAKYVLLFRFKDSTGNRTSHFIIFITKNFKGYRLMKESMGTFSSWNEDGVPSFEYNSHRQENNLLGQLNKPIEKLAMDLCQCFAGKKLTLDQIIEQHSVDTPYIEKNYRDALKKLEKLKVLTFDPPTRRAETYGENTHVIFPDLPSLPLDFDSLEEPNQQKLF